MIEMHESGWWEGSCRDNIGLFPGSYVEVVEMYTTGAAGDEEEDKNASDAQKRKSAAATTAAPAAAATVDAGVTTTNSGASSSAAVVATVDDQLLEARRFALHFKAMYDAKVAELAGCALAVSQLEGARAEAAESGKSAAQAQEQLAQVTAAKNTLEARLAASDTGGGGDSAAAVAALEAELTLAKQQRQAQQTKVEQLDQELRAALDVANDANAKVAALEAAALAAPRAEAAAAADPAVLDTLHAELKQAKQQRLALQTKVDGMDVELREALDRANEAEAKAKALETGGAAAVPQELGDGDVLKAELRMAKQQRQTLQTKVDEMDMELREALDKANEGAAAVKALAEAQATIKKLQAGGEGGATAAVAGGGGEKRAL